jgi:hypothetical protein
MEYRFGRGIWGLVIYPYLRKHNIKDRRAVGNSFNGTVNLIINTTEEHVKFLDYEQEIDRSRRLQFVSRD